MARLYEGKIIVNLDDFWEWVRINFVDSNDYIVYGVPKVNVIEKTFEIDFAASSDGSPEEWPSKPKAIRQWEGNRNKDETKHE